MKARVSVRLQCALEVLQMRTRMFSLAILRISKPHGRSGLLTGGAFVANVSPQPSGFGFTGAGREHRHRRIVGVDLAPSQDMLAQRINQRTEQRAGCAHPAGQCGALDLDALPRINLRLAIKRLVIAILRNQHMRQQRRPGQSALDGPRRGRSLDHHALAGRAGELGPHVANHLEALRDVLQLLAHVFAELLQRSAAIRAALVFGSMCDGLARQMRRQGLALGPRLGRRLGRTPSAVVSPLQPVRSPALPVPVRAAPTEPRSSRSSYRRSCAAASRPAASNVRSARCV